MINAYFGAKQAQTSLLKALLKGGMLAGWLLTLCSAGAFVGGEGQAGAGVKRPAAKDGLYAWRIHARAERFMNENTDISADSGFLIDPSIRYFTGAAARVRNSFLDLDLDWTYSFKEEHHYIRPYELAVKTTRPDGKWIIGRHRLEWDWADRFWNRGLWQAFYREDALRAKQGGLTGFFREFYYEQARFVLFGSPVFMAEDGPYFEEINGRLVSQNPWFTPPPTGKIGFTNITPSYHIASVSWQDFMRLSLAGLAQYKNFYIGYGYKPLNTVRVKTTLALDLSKKPDGSHTRGYKVPFSLEPVFLKHHIAVLGWTAKHSNYLAGGARQVFRLKSSLTYNHPEKFESTKANTVFFQPQNEWHFAVKGEMHIQDDTEETMLDVSYTQTFQNGEFHEAKNVIFNVFPKFNEQQFFRNDLFLFSQAVSGGLYHSMKWTQEESTALSARLVYHFVKQYFLFSFQGSATVSRRLTFTLSGDILFSGFPFDSQQTEDNIGLYQNQSRVSGGVSYVF